MSKTSARELAMERLCGYISEYLAHKRSSTDIAYDIVDLASVYPDFYKEEKEPILSRIWDVATQLELPEEVSEIKHADGWKELVELTKLL